MPPDRERQEILDGIDELMSLFDQFSLIVRGSRRHYRAFRSRIERGDTLHDALSAIPAGDLRQGLTQVMADLESARHRVRRATIAMGIEEGVSIGELGRLWGFSRQLAARYAKEIREVDATSEAS